MVQIVNETNAGQRFGTALGSGLSSGLQALSNYKLNEMQEQRKQQLKAKEIERSAQNFAKMFPNNPELAWTLANTDPRIAANIVGGLDLGNLFNPAQQQGQQGQQIPKALTEPPQDQQQEQVQEAIGEIGQGQPWDPRIEALKAPKQRLEIPKKKPQNMTPEEKANAQQLAEEDKIVGKAPGLETTKSKERREDIYYKETYPKIKESNAKVKNIKEQNAVLDRFINLTEKGDVQELLPVLNDWLEHSVGIDIKKFYNGDTSELDKLSNFWSKGAKDVFGSRVTNFDLQNILAQYPNLRNSPKGRLQIAKQIKILNDIPLEENKVINEFDEKYPYLPPQKFDRLVNNRMEDYKDQKYAEFKNSIYQKGQVVEKPTTANAAKYKGFTIEDNGVQATSDGKKWTFKKIGKKA